MQQFSSLLYTVRFDPFVTPSFPRYSPLLGGIVLVLSLLAMGGCDVVSGGKSQEGQSPRVSDLQVVTDSVRVSEADSSARLTLDLAARATDPDGTVERVVFLLEPSSSPRGTVSGDLRSVKGSLYAGRIQFAVPLVEEIFTVRVFAVDDDSLTSNQVTGQFRFEPSEQSGSTSAGPLSDAAGDPFTLRAVRPRLPTAGRTSAFHRWSPDDRSVHRSPRVRRPPIWALGMAGKGRPNAHTPVLGA